MIRKNNYVAVGLVFVVFLPLNGKQEKSKLSILCASAVNKKIKTKTLLGSPFKQPLLGVVVDYERLYAILFPQCYVMGRKFRLKVLVICYGITRASFFTGLF